MRKYLPKFKEGDVIRDTGKKISKIEGAESLDFMNASKYATSGIQAGPSGDEIKKQHEARVAEGQAQGNPAGKGISPEMTGAATKIGIQAGGAVLDSVTAGMDVDENSSFKAEQALGDALMASGNPYAAAAGLAVKGMSALSQATGTNINTISKKEANKIGVSGAGRVLNNVAGFMSNIGLLGPGAGALVGKTDSVKLSEQAAQLGASYAGSIDDISTAEGMSGGRYFVGRDKINDLIREAKRQNYMITDIAQTNTQRKMSDYGTNLAQQNLNRYAGNNYQNTHIGKHGMKLISAEEIRMILNARKESDIQSFHNGGVIGIDVNVIAEGKYHAHKNYLGDISDEFEDLTKKGIPVVTRSEGGELNQLAEIEKKELIFRLDVTTRLEELYEDGSDEAAIEAGKLLAIEIMENTQDNSGEVLVDE